MLAPGKGWVLAILPMLAAKRRLRVGPGGSGPGYAALAFLCACRCVDGIGTRNRGARKRAVRSLRGIEQGTGKEGTAELLQLDPAQTAPTDRPELPSGTLNGVVRAHRLSSHYPHKYDKVSSVGGVHGRY